MQEQDIVDAEFEEIADGTIEPNVDVGTVGHIDHGKSMFTDTTPEPSPKMTKSELVQALNTAHDDGHIDAKQVKSMKAELGIFSSTFTKKKQSTSKRKSNRALQKKARRKQRK